MSENRRRDPRFEVSVTAEIVVGEDVFEGETKNISASGVNLEVDGIIQDSIEVTLMLMLTQDGIEDPTTEPLSLPAHVMWVAPTDAGAHMVGLRFGTLGAGQQERLAGLLERQE